MNLDAALERLRDIPTDDLLVVGQQLQDDYNTAKERWDRAKAEITERQDKLDSTLLLGEAVMCETKWTGETEWDVETVKELAPEHAVWVPSVRVPGHWKVKNTLALNNHIKNLGKSEAGTKLRNARRYKRKYATLKFTEIIDSRGQ